MIHPQKKARFLEVLEAFVTLSGLWVHPQKKARFLGCREASSQDFMKGHEEYL
jgi:hypothetical protein